VGDVDAFVEWLQANGTPGAHLAAHRHYAEELDKHPSLSAALRYHEDAGAPASRLANLKATAAKRAEYEQSLVASVPRPRPLAAEPVPYRPAEPAAHRPADVPALAVERPKPRTLEPNPRWTQPRVGCICNKRYDLYLDNDFGGLAKMLGGGIGIGTILLMRMIGVVGALAVALGLAGLGGLATFFTICLRCEGCRKPISKDLDDDERSTMRKGRAMVGLVTAGLLAGAALCVFIWITAVKAAQHHY
jgi:hypothetical protein